MEKHKITQLDRIARYADLIQKQAGKAVRPYRADGYVNMMTRMVRRRMRLSSTSSSRKTLFPTSC